MAHRIQYWDKGDVATGFYVNVIEQKAEVFFNLKLLNYKIELLDFPWV